MKASRFLCVFFAAILLLFGILILILPKTGFSETENRALASPPDFSLDAILSGECAADIDSFYADHFALRSFFLKTKAIAELFALKRENGGVIAASDRYLIKRQDRADLEMLKQNQEKTEDLTAQLQKSGKPVILLCAPRATDVLADKLPALYPQEIPNRVYNILPASSLHSLLREKANRGERVFYRTDHHWSTLGAYYAYVSLGEALGYTPYPLDAFQKETVSESFLGSAAAASLFPAITPDSIELARYEGDTELVRIDLSTGERKNGLYDFKKLKTADAYGVFLGGNFAHIRIESNEKDRPLLLIIKDSYANSLVPFLSRHFDMELIDPRYLRVPSGALLKEITERENYIGTLLLWNAETLSGDIGLSLLLTS